MNNSIQNIKNIQNNQKITLDQLVNLQKVVKELNSKDEDGDSMYEFQIELIDNKIKIYDKKEEYSINYVDEMNELIQELKEEFGSGFDYIKEDEIYEKLNKALKEDLKNEESYFDWENSVVLIAAV